MAGTFSLSEPTIYPPPPPPLETHFFEVSREVGEWRVLVGGGGGVKNVEKNDPHFFSVENDESFGFFFDFEPKSVSGSQLHGVCMGRSGTSAFVVYAQFC